MPSTYRVPGYPGVSEGYWHKDGTYEAAKPKTNNLKLVDWLRYPKAALMQHIIQRHRQRIQALAQALPDYPLADDATVTQVIAQVPDLLLAPLEFELSPEIRKYNQHYPGLCQCENRHDTELDETFANQWPQLLANRLPGVRAPVAGRVSFTSPWQEQQSLSAGQDLLSVEPARSTYQGLVKIPQANLGKLREGQTVLIKLEGYPFREYGMVEGTLSQLSVTPGSDNAYWGYVDLPRGLQTRYGQRLAYRNGLKGTAEIIAADRRLAERLVDGGR